MTTNRCALCGAEFRLPYRAVFLTLAGGELLGLVCQLCAFQAVGEVLQDRLENMDQYGGRNPLTPEAMHLIKRLEELVEEPGT